MQLERPYASESRWTWFYGFLAVLCAGAAVICFMSYADAKQASDVLEQIRFQQSGMDYEAFSAARSVHFFQGGVAFIIMGLTFVFAAIVVDKLAYTAWAAVEQVNLQQQLIESIEDLKEGSIASVRLCELIEGRQKPAAPTASATPEQTESRQGSPS